MPPPDTTLVANVCDSVSGAAPFSDARAKLRVAPSAATRMMCEGNTMQVESRLSSALQSSFVPEDATGEPTPTGASNHRFAFVSSND